MRARGPESLCAAADAAICIPANSAPCQQCPLPTHKRYCPTPPPPAQDVGLKQRIFADLEAACGPNAILATNTSTIDIDLVSKEGRS